jgi:hypothetical protein
MVSKDMSNLNSSLAHQTLALTRSPTISSIGSAQQRVTRQFEPSSCSGMAFCVRQDAGRSKLESIGLLLLLLLLPNRVACSS